MLSRFTAGRHWSKAEKLFARGDFHRARAEFDRAVELRPGSSAIHLRYAIFLSETNDPAAAVSHAERAVEIRPKSAPYRLFYGRILMDNGRTAEAGEQFAAAKDLNPRNQLARDYSALIEIVEGDVEAGLREMSKAGLSQNTAFHAQALVALERLVRLEHGPPEPKPLNVESDNYPTRGLFRNWRAARLLSDGIHLLDVKEWERAVRKFRRARALAPQIIESRFQEGVACFMAGDFPQAEAIMSELVGEGDEPALYLGAAMAEQGRYEEALGVLKKIARPTPEYHYYVGLYLLSVGQEREARSHFAEAADKRHELLLRTFEKACEEYGEGTRGTRD